ncbi:TSC22 domain family protein 1-like [Lates japonicus]|uniref:TSC22 domain family protein 1-like protein n=1 Tax=Lates japonicus TaxID=270547 RepID=A0AAD3MQ92_LATJO|nr:TSC22 domain family protein 1-like protein [Lates japonicus]
MLMLGSSPPLPDCFMSGSRDHARSPYYGAPLPSSPVTAHSHSSGAGGYILNNSTAGGGPVIQQNQHQNEDPVEWIKPLAAPVLIDRIRFYSLCSG